MGPDRGGARGDRRPPRGVALSSTSLVFENVSYAYEEAAREAVSDLSLSIAVGEWVGVTGPTNDGRPKHPLDLVDSLKAPVLGLYAGADQGIPNTDVEKMRAALKAANKPSEIVLYDGVPHGFHADYRPSYRKEAADDAWNQMQAWFKKYGVLS